MVSPEVKAKFICSASWPRTKFTSTPIDSLVSSLIAAATSFVSSVLALPWPQTVSVTTDADYNSIYTDPAVVQTSVGESYEQPAASFQKAVQTVRFRAGSVLPCPISRRNPFLTKTACRWFPLGCCKILVGSRCSFWRLST